MTSIYIRQGFIFTMSGDGLGIIEDGALAIDGQRIIAVGKTSELDSNYGNSDTVIDAKMKSVLPGFIDAHTHTGSAITRGVSQDVPEIEWMFKTRAPFDKYTKPHHSMAGAALAVLEAVKSGVTTLGEIGSNMGYVAEHVFVPSGIRANVASTVNEIGPESRPDPNKPYI